MRCATLRLLHKADLLLVLSSSISLVCVHYPRVVSSPLFELDYCITWPAPTWSAILLVRASWTHPVSYSVTYYKNSNATRSVTWRLASFTRKSACTCRSVTGQMLACLCSLFLIRWDSLWRSIWQTRARTRWEYTVSIYCYYCTRLHIIRFCFPLLTVELLVESIIDGQLQFS